MNSNFKRFKRRVRAFIIMKSVMLGLGLSLAALAAFMTVFKLCAIDVSPVWYILSALVASAAVFGIFFFFLRQSDNEIAKHIDEDLALDEKVRTMVAFRERDGDVISAQRTDAEERLKDSKLSSLRPRRLVSCVAVLLVASLMLIGSVFVPLRVVAEPEEIPLGDFEHKWIVDRLTALVDVVDKSFVKDNIKEQIKSELNTLIDAVKSSEKLSDMKAQAIVTLVNVDRIVEEANNAPDFAEKLRESDTDVLKKLGDELSTLSGSAVKKQMKKVKSFISGADEPEDALYDVAEQIDAYLRVSGIPIDSQVYRVFKTFANALTEMHGAGNLSSLDSAFVAVDEELPDILLAERDNRTIGDTVVNELAVIFNITEDDLLSTEGGGNIEIDKTPTTQPIPPEDDDEEMSTEGGFAEGGNSYASDDVVYSPELGKYVSYGEIFDLYFGKYNDKRLEGVYDEELLEFLKAYFDALY